MGRVEAGPFGSDFTFTGEQTDANGLVYLRARYYSPALGVFPSLDPLEGDIGRPMSLNRYGYVVGNVVSMVDPSGMIYESPGAWATCVQTDDDCLTTVYVGCNLSSGFALPAMPFPAFTLGTDSLSPIHSYSKGSRLCVREIRGNWLRISDYNQFENQTHWVYSFNPSDFSQRVLFENIDDAGCSSVTPTPTPTATSSPSATGTPSVTITPGPTPTATSGPQFDQIDLEHLRCVLDIEAAQDPNQALDIAHVIRNRQKVSGPDPFGNGWRTSAVNIVKAPAAFQAWRDRCQNITGYQSEKSAINILAYQLFLDLELPEPTVPEIYSALFTWGEYAGKGGLSPERLDQYLINNRGKDARTIVSESCSLVSSDNYITHSGTSDSGFFTTFFSSDAGCAGG